MNNVAILAAVAALAIAVEIQTLRNLAPVLWPQIGIQAASLCAGSDPDGGCPEVEPRPVWLKDFPR